MAKKRKQSSKKKVVAPSRGQQEKAPLAGAPASRGSKAQPGQRKASARAAAGKKKGAAGRGGGAGAKYEAGNEAPARRAQSAAVSAEQAADAAMHAVPGHLMDPNEGTPAPQGPPIGRRQRLRVWAVGICVCCAIVIMLIMLMVMLRAAN